ncbi:hypothetical protein SAMN05428982_0223 [Pseudoxanthomonas sp. CF385]|nr:hypothetical protein SAMN05428982_0223 [Pseudoxanthomonas sp. CF385]
MALARAESLGAAMPSVRQCISRAAMLSRS